MELPFRFEPHTLTREALDLILTWAFRNGASDVCIGTGMPIMVGIAGRKIPVVRRRIARYEIASVLNAIYERDATAIIGGQNSLPFSYEIPSGDTRLRYRVNAGGCDDGGRDGLMAVFRIIPSLPPSVESLEIEPELMRGFFPSRGLVLVTGKTGSGKTTLLAAVVRHILETTDKAVFTYESPVEFVYQELDSLKGIIFQVEIPRHLKSYADAVRDSLRNAPDVVLIGEARDAETIRGVVEEVKTGHTVYTTLHTDSVVGTVPRMLDVFPHHERDMQKNQIFEALRLIVHQRLAPGASGGKRVALREYIHVTPEIREAAFRAGVEDISGVMRKFLPKYGRSIFDAAMEAYRRGQITAETFEYISSDEGIGFNEIADKDIP